MLKYSYLLLFGLVTVSGASAFNCSTSVPSIICTCREKPRKLKCISTEADNNTLITVVNDILQSSNISEIFEIHLESLELQSDTGILFQNISIRILVITNSNLTELNELSLSNLKELIKLDLSNNSLKSIPSSSLHHLSALQHLILSSNKIQHIYKEDLKSLSKLQSLSLSDNVISTIDDGSFSSLGSCTSLFILKNMLSSLQSSIFEGLKKLSSLDVSSNKISSLPRDLLDHIPQLISFRANNNNFTSLKSIEIISASLKILSLKNSSINGPLEPGIVKGLPNLEKLSLGNNPIGRILPYSFAHMWKLKGLELDSCQLHSLDEGTFYNLTHLSKLDLSNNLLQKLTCVDTSPLESLEKINLENNTLETIEKGAFYYSDSLADLSLKGNKLQCDCRLQFFSELVRNKSLQLHNIECTNGFTLDKADFGKMNCFNNTDICTKTKNESSISTAPSKEFTITFVKIMQFDDSLGINYFINKSSNFSDDGFSCKILSKHVDEGEFQEAAFCDLNANYVNIAVLEGKGNYNVCIHILNNETVYFSECQLVDYDPPDTTTTDDQSTSDTSETTSSTTALFSVGKSTIPITTNTSVITSELETSTTPPPHNETEESSDEGTLVSSHLSSLSTETSMRTSVPITTTTQFPAHSETVTHSQDATKPSFEVAYINSYSFHEDPNGQLSLTWNLTLKDPQIPCYLDFSVFPYNNHPKRNWQRACKSGSFFVRDMKSTDSYQVCLTLFIEQKVVEKNCTEISPPVSPSAASSQSTGLSAQLPMAAFFVLIVLAVIILILIIIVMIKLLYLKRNKTNVYYVAKEEVNNYAQTTKRSSNLYSVSSLEDDQV